MLDGGRLRPLEDESPRIGDPCARCRASARRRTRRRSRRRSRSGRPRRVQRPWRSVQSAPLRTRLEQMMQHSDNVLAETIGREIAISSGSAPTFTGAVEAVTRTLQGAGIDTPGVTLQDLSGLSVDDRIPARVLDSILDARRRPGRSGLASDARLPAGRGCHRHAQRPLRHHCSRRSRVGTRENRHTGLVQRACGIRRGRRWPGTDVRTHVERSVRPTKHDPRWTHVAAVLRGCGCR